MGDDEILDEDKEPLWRELLQLAAKPQRATYRREDLTLKKLWQQYLKKRTITALIYIVWFTFCFGTIFMPDDSDYNSAADARGRIVAGSVMHDLPQSARTAARKQFGHALLETYARGVATDIRSGSDTPEHTASVFDQVNRMANTGEPVRLDTRHQGFSDHPWNTISRYLMVFGGLIALALSVRYSFRTLVKAEFLADLPWKRGWPFVFAALMPPLWPVFAISALRMHNANSSTGTKAEEEQAEEYAFEADESAARTFYFDLRFGKWQDFVSDRLKAIQSRLDELAVRAKARQTERGQLTAEQRNLEAFDVTADAPDSTKVEQEFQTILEHPSVHGINKVGSRLHVYVKARFTHDGLLYDLGDWVIKVSTSGLTTEEVRTGTKVAWHVFAHPIYRVDDGVFCFGHRRTTIDSLLERSQIAEAITLAVTCLGSINPDDLALIDKAFKVIDETPT